MLRFWARAQAIGITGRIRSANGTNVPGTELGLPGGGVRTTGDSVAFYVSPPAEAVTIPFNHELTNKRRLYGSLSPGSHVTKW